VRSPLYSAGLLCARQNPRVAVSQRLRARPPALWTGPAPTLRPAAPTRYGHANAATEIYHPRPKTKTGQPQTDIK